LQNLPGPANVEITTGPFSEDVVFTSDVSGIWCAGPPLCGSGDFGSTSQFSVVPLPPTALLFASGLAGLGLLGWRRKRAAAG
jgi:hypothetical protein